MMEHEMNSERSSSDKPHVYSGYGDHDANTFAHHLGEKNVPMSSRLVPPIGERLLLGLISVILWVGMALFELFVIGYLHSLSTFELAFIVFSMGLVTACLVLINVIFCRIGWFWLKRHHE